MTFLCRFLAGVIIAVVLIAFDVGQEEGKKENAKVEIKRNEDGDKAVVQAETLTTVLNNIPKYSIDDYIRAEAETKGIKIEMQFDAREDLFEVVLENREKRVSFYVMPDIDTIRRRIILTLAENFQEENER